MKCYTVDESRMRGLILTGAHDQQPKLFVGEPSTSMSIPCGTNLQRVFKQRAAYIESMRNSLLDYSRKSSKEALEALEHMYEAALLNNPQLQARITDLRNIPYNELQSQRIKHLVMTSNKRREPDCIVHARAWADEDPTLLRMYNADLSDNPPTRFIVERTRPRDENTEAHKNWLANVYTCLVHVRTLAPIDGRMWLTGGSYQDSIEGQEVHRTYGEFPSPGIDVLAVGLGPSGEPHALLRLRRNASFRIHREGDMRTFEDAPHAKPRPKIITVTWNGQALFTDFDHRRRKNKAA